MFQVTDCVFDHGFLFHDHGVRGVNDFVVAHAIDLSALDGDFAIVGTGDHHRVNPVDAAISCQDAAIKVNRSELGDIAVGRCAELLSGRAIDFTEGPPIADCINDFAALIGWSQHDNSAEIGNGIRFLELPHKDAAHRVGHEVHVFGVLGGLYDFGAK